MSFLRSHLRTCLAVSALVLPVLVPATAAAAATPGSATYGPGQGPGSATYGPDSATYGPGQGPGSATYGPDSATYGPGQGPDSATYGPGQGPGSATYGPSGRPDGTPFFISHGGGVHNATATSTNWSGYAATGAAGAYKSVTTTFKQPAVNCSKGSGYSSFWVGLDGDGSNSVEQTGTEADCSGGSATYSAWYELYPASPVTYSNAVSPGDTIVEKVTFSGTDTYTLYLADTTKGWHHSTVKASSGHKRSSAEVIAEAPSSLFGVLPLSDFGTVNFTGSTVNGGTLAAANPTGIDMVSSSKKAEATVGALSGGNFSDTWNSL